MAILPNVTNLALLFSFQHFLVHTAYVQKDHYSSSTFFDNFIFFTASDPTNGYVQYVDQATAQQSGLISTADDAAYIGVDRNTTLSGGTGRQSVRIYSKGSYDSGLFVADFNHMPGGICGVWPAFWTVGPNWPNGGEIDILEGVNLDTNNLMSLHTSANCSTSGTGQTGTVVTNDCYQYSSTESGTGCGNQDPRNDSFGADFNSRKGGVYAMELATQYIRIWFFPRSLIPTDIASGAPDPSGWGTPVSNFEGSCDIPSHFSQQQITIDTDFCGDLAGNLFSQEPTCKTLAASCNEYVGANPGAFADAYWSINYIAVYTSQTVAATPTAATSTVSLSSEVSSVVPLASTSSISETAVAPGQTLSTTENASTSQFISTSSPSLPPLPSNTIGQASSTPSTHLTSALNPSSSTSSHTPSMSSTASSSQSVSSSIPQYTSSPAAPPPLGSRPSQSTEMTNPSNSPLSLGTTKSHSNLHSPSSSHHPSNGTSLSLKPSLHPSTSSPNRSTLHNTITPLGSSTGHMTPPPPPPPSTAHNSSSSSPHPHPTVHSSSSSSSTRSSHDSQSSATTLTTKTSPPPAPSKISTTAPSNTPPKLSLSHQTPISMKPKPEAEPEATWRRSKGRCWKRPGTVTGKDEDETSTGGSSGDDDDGKEGEEEEGVEGQEKDKDKDKDGKDGRKRPLCGGGGGGGALPTEGL